MKTNDYKHLYYIHFNNSLIITLHCNTQGCCQEHPGTITMLWEEWCYGKNGDGRQDHARPLRVLISVLISGAPKEMGETKQAGDHPTHGPRLVKVDLYPFNFGHKVQSLGWKLHKNTSRVILVLICVLCTNIHKLSNEHDWFFISCGLICSLFCT